MFIKQYTELAPAFYQLSQSTANTPQDVMDTWKTPLSSDNPKFGNPQALWVSARALATLAKNDKINFRPQHYQEDGDSEEDVEKHTCSLM